MRCIWFQPSLCMALIAALSMLASACSAPSKGPDLVVGLQTDLVPRFEFDEVQLFLVSVDDVRNSGLRQERKVLTDDFLQGGALGSFTLPRAGAYRLDVVLRSQSRGVVLSQRPVLVSAETNVALTVPIDRSCQNVRCPLEDDPATPEDESTFIACLGGQCVDPRCTVETPEFCLKDPLCVDDSDCVGEADCAGAFCSLGACWAEPKLPGDAGACNAESAWCHPDLGCTPFEGTVDENEQTTSTLPPHCASGLLDEDEAGVDCGGSCPACAERVSTVVADSCLDGVMGAGELGIDCGGSCTPCRDETYDCTAQSQIPVHECRALVALDWHMGAGNTPTHPDAWFLSPPCSWEGISCRNGHVEEWAPGFGSTGGHLFGQLPPEIGNLREMTRLRFQNVNINSTIPVEIGTLSKLDEFNAGSNCRFRGTIPPELAALPNLRRLGLSQGGMTGQVPAALLAHPKLEFLDLSDNAFEGDLSHVTEVGPRLSGLFLNGNRLHGPVPTAFEGLNTLWLSENACLWAEECNSLKPYLDAEDRRWQSSNRDVGCSPPPTACP